MKIIFLADDDADDRMFFEDALQKVSIPAQLTTANDGLELMNNLESVIPPPPDVIFLDLNMPLKNGLQCLEEIRSTAILKSIPVVIFSTTASDEEVSKTYQHGANHYICKPRSFGLLVKAIETVLTLDMWMKPQPNKEEFVLTIT
ncbi:MAG: response regulator [Bacteroidota bacterium]